jgi:ferredoxin
MLSDLIDNGIPAWILLLVAAGLIIYTAAAVWTHLSVGKLLWENLFRVNRVEQPHLGQAQSVPSVGADQAESTAIVLARTRLPVNTGKAVTRDFTNLVYPVAGRNGLHFTPDRCTSCGLCVYSCPTGAVTTHDQPKGYLRRFNLADCLFCGLCESVCPTSAIRLTFNPTPTQPEAATMLVEGPVAALPCRICGQKIPQADLMAERIYQPPFDAETTEEIVTYFQQIINPSGACLECQKRVLEAEEQI